MNDTTPRPDITPAVREELTSLHAATQRARARLFTAKPTLHQLGEESLTLALLAHLADVALAAVNALVWALGQVIAETPPEPTT